MGNSRSNIPFYDPTIKMIGEEDENKYFMQGDMPLNGEYDKAKPAILDPLDRTLFFKITNTTSLSKTAVIFGSQSQAQPAGVIVSTDQDNVFIDTGTDQEPIRNDTIANAYYIEGLRMIFIHRLLPQNFQAQKVEPLIVSTTSITGKKDEYVFQSAMGFSPCTIDNNILDFPTFILPSVNNDFQIEYNVLGGQKVIMIFTIKRRLDHSKNLFGANKLEIANYPRQTGIPLFDMMQEKEVGDLLESGFNSQIQKAFD